MITTEQKEYVREAIVDISSVQFQDFYKEMNDHYLSSIETNMTEGKDFEVAFHQIHDSFLNHSYSNIRKRDGYEMTYYGLEAMQWEYHDKMEAAVKKRHWAIVKSYFRWPTVVSTLLGGLLVYQLAELMKGEVKILITAIIVSMFLPFLIIIPLYLKYRWEHYVKQDRLLLKSTKLNIMIRRATAAGLPVYIINLSHLFDTDSFSSSIILAMWSFFLFCYLIFATSFWQLYREQFKVKIV
jgi:hypothetical protein